ncbi:MAG: hypothetical protein WBN53_16970, partial [Thermodesulfobacteriota bacterium]
QESWAGCHSFIRSVVIPKSLSFTCHSGLDPESRVPDENRDREYKLDSRFHGNDAQGDTELASIVMLNLGLMKIRLGSASRDTEVLEPSEAHQWRCHSNGLRIFW